MNIIQHHALLVFFLLAFVIATLAFIALTPQTPIAVQLPLLILGSYAPTLAAFAVLTLSRDVAESRAFRQRLRTWRVGARWYLIAVLLPTTIWLGAAVAMVVLGTGKAIQAAGLLFFPVIFVTNLGEELGWRGFALPRLMARFRPLTASLILGFVWGAFHVPLYWQRPTLALLIFALTLAVSVVLTWLFIHTGGSVLLCTLFHAVFNTWSQVLLTAQGAESLFAVAILLLWIVAGFLVVRYGSDLSRAAQAQTEMIGAG